MILSIDFLLVILVCANLLLLGSSRLLACIHIVAVQGILIGLLLVVSNLDHLSLHIVLLAMVIVGIKGWVFPRLLGRALREVRVRREVEPYIGYSLSIVLGLVALAASLAMGKRLPLPMEVQSPIVIPIALFTILTGLILIVSRKKALTQVLGYLVMENGVFIIGIELAHASPLLFELGALLDILVAVFIMGIIIFHINRQFDHIDTDRLTVLKDWSS